MDFGVLSLIKYSAVAWLKDASARKDTLLLFGALIVITLVTFGSQIVFGSMFPKTAPENFSFATFIPMILSVGALSLVSFIVGIIQWIVTYGINYRLISRSLTLEKRASEKLTPWRFIRYSLGVPIATMIISFLCLYNIKFLALLGIFIVFVILATICFVFGGAAAIIGLVFLFIAILALIAYGIVVIYNSYRLLVAEAIFVEKEVALLDSLKTSWNLTQGNVFPLFLASLGTGLVFLLIFIVFAGPSMGYAFTYGFMTALNNPTAAEGLQTALLKDPIFIVLSIISLVWSAARIAISSFFVVGAYVRLGPKPSAPQKNTVRRPLEKKR